MRTVYSFTVSPSSAPHSVTPDLLYGETQPFGFVTETNRGIDPSISYPELSSGFDVPYWYQNTRLTHILQDETGCYLKEDNIPLCFEANVDQQGNYLAQITLTNPTSRNIPYILFTGRRRLVSIQSIAAQSTVTIQTQINVTDIIPRGQTERKKDSSINISLIGSEIRLTSVTLTYNHVPTIFIAGDSTVTDQSGDYPYRPEHCYSGWGQALPVYLNSTVSASNHAHSGLTTESFRNEGHHKIVLEAIRPGDFFFMQFAHNDQKLDHLKAEGGYRENLIYYIEEIRALGAFPVLVTPLARNTWKGIDGTYNDLLADHAAACRRIADEYKVPLIDLHKASTSYIIAHGLEDSRRLFYPGDYTHTNDYGAVMMASFVASACRKIHSYPGYEALANAIVLPDLSFNPPIVVTPVQPPEGLTDDRPKQTGASLSSSIERPDEPITRAEALALLIQAVHFFPTNVYNDMFEDIVGHEWYAGTIECAYQNGMIDPNLVADKMIKPMETATLAEFISMALNAYASRKAIPSGDNISVLDEVPAWQKPYLKSACALGFITNSDSASVPLLRKDALSIALKISTLIG